MKSIHIAAVAVIGVLLLVTVAIAQRFVSDESTEADEKPVVTSRDPSPSFSPDVNSEGGEQAKQLAEALEEMKELMEIRTRQITVTVRDEPPLEIWEVEGNTCTMVNSLSPTTIQVMGTSDPLSFVSYPVTAVARRLPSGGCEADLMVAGHDSATFDISLILDGRRTTTQSMTRGSGLEVTLVH